MKHFLHKVASTEDRNTLINIDGTQDDCLQTPERTIAPIEEILKPLHRGEELRRSVISAIKECYPGIQKLTAEIVPSKIYIGNGNYLDKYCLIISWENSASECLVQSVIECVLCDYFEYSQGIVSKSKLKIQMNRRFTDDVILKASKKYADCVAPNLPLNMHNIRCFKIGGVPIYDLALGELQLFDYIK